MKYILIAYFVDCKYSTRTCVYKCIYMYMYITEDRHIYMYTCV